MTTGVALLSREQIERLPERARDVMEYRKSGLSLNHIQGCALDCAYCIRHTYGLWDQQQPRALMTDAEAVEELVNHRYSAEHLERAHELAQHADATVFTGLFYRDQIAAHYKANKLPEPYDETARRKIGRLGRYEPAPVWSSNCTEMDREALGR